MVVGEGLVALHGGELRVVGHVEALVAEDSPDFVDLFDSSDDELLEVQFRCDSEVEVAVEGVVVGGERAGGPAGRDLHQHGRFDLDEAAPVHESPQRADRLAPHHGDAPAVLVRYQVEVALAEPGLDVGEAVPLLGQAANGLRERRPILNLDGGLARPRAEDGAGRADPVADVEFLECGVALAEVVAAKEQLDLAFAVLDVGEGGASHAAIPHDAPADGYAFRAGLALAVVLRLRSFEQIDGLARRVSSVVPVRIGVDARVAEPLELLQADVHQLIFRFGHLSASIRRRGRR